MIMPAVIVHFNSDRVVYKNNKENGGKISGPETATSSFSAEWTSAASRNWLQSSTSPISIDLHLMFLHIAITNEAVVACFRAYSL